MFKLTILNDYLLEELPAEEAAIFNTCEKVFLEDGTIYPRGFEYSTDKDVTDCVYCVMVDNTNGYEIFITVVMYRNGTRTELGVVLKSDNKNDVMTCGTLESYAVFRTRMHMIHHKATKRLIKRIYERMIIPMMNREVYEHLMSEEKEC